MTNQEVARVLRQIADILQIKDDNPFKVKAYRKAADAIYHFDEDINVLDQTGRIAEIPGVGLAVRDKVEELLRTGSLVYHEKLLQEVPIGVLAMLRLPGLGPRTVKSIYEQLSITSMDELLKAAEEHRLRALPGVGEKTELAIIKGIEEQKQSRGKMTLGEALPLAENLLRYLLGTSPVLDGSIVGSVRRGKPLVSDIDILLATRQPDKLVPILNEYAGIKQITAIEPGHIQGQLSGEIDFEIIMVDPEYYYFVLVRATGSKAHREIIFNEQYPESFLGARGESEIYQRLGMSYIPPELRENRGEIELARTGELPQLLNLPDIRGDLHIHSKWSDGGEGIAEMAGTAVTLGYEYIAITDHSKSLSISGGLNEARLALQGREIDVLQADLPLTILKGIEVDIMKDGALDFSDDVLAGLDLVIASIHSYFKLDKVQQTERIIKAIQNPHVDIIGHLSGRLLNRRSGYELDTLRIIEAAAEYKTVLEINAHPDRLDIDEETAIRAKEYGVKMVINTDAHHRLDFSLMRYGVMNARRAWLEPADVLNTLSKERLLGYLSSRQF
ncbi:MAG: DNA polymerase/3'-5' exonuclease PolX [Deltaproteobacteria bacterium]